MEHEDDYLYDYYYIEIKHIKSITDSTVKKFKSKFNVFTDITVKLAKSLDYTDALAFYSHGSAVHYLHPLIILDYGELSKLPKDELSFAVETTILHELGHAMVDMDNAYLFREDQENIFKFEDEEDFVEKFATNFNSIDPSFKEFKTYAERLIGGEHFDIYSGYQ